MFKKLIRKLARKVGVKPLAAEVIAETADDVIMEVVDAKTSGLASEVEQVVKRNRKERKKNV